MKIVGKVASDIKKMRVQGAINIALAAVYSLEILIKKSKAGNKKEFVRELKKAGELLISTRPSAVALPNAVNLYIKKIKGLKGNIENIKKKALEIGIELVEKNKEAVKEIAKKGAELVKSNSNILIHCHSSTVIEILKEAKRKGKKFHVICTETRPWRQGLISAKELAKAKIPATLIVDSAVTSLMPSVNLVLVGADTITKDKKLINKIGTAQIALIAKTFGVPFYCAAQKLKFTSKRAKHISLEERPANEILEGKKLAGVKIKNVVFDITDLKGINGVITGAGIRKYKK